jgi:hypothetical protein
MKTKIKFKYMVPTKKVKIKKPENTQCRPGRGTILEVHNETITLEV